MIPDLPLGPGSLAPRYGAGELTPTDVVEEVWRRCEAHGDPAVWIHRLSLEDLRRHARRVESRGRASQPLYGVPFAIKDNIDLAGSPTTAACPAFAYAPSATAFAVARLLEAGAIPVGKTNLDQFATGLVGVRSPYGTPRNAFHPEAIPGGSSSGSAAALAAGLVGFSLGTDTAGSGRVPAAFNNLVGLKPTRGWISTRGVVPACRSLDCVSVFASSVADARLAAAAAACYDPADPYSRRPRAPAWPSGAPAPGKSFRFGVPSDADLEWFGDPHSPGLFASAVEKLSSLGGERVEIDFSPFRAAARLLYEGPWVAERWLAIREFHGKSADAILPVTRRIIEQAFRYSAADAFAALSELEGHRRSAAAAWDRIDTLVLPTAATVYTRSQVEADPVALNTNLGAYTNFANLLDCAALAVPAGFRPDGIPFGITLFGPAWSDGRLSALGGLFAGEPVARGGAAPPPAPGRLEIAVVGAHLSGQPLNAELTSRDGRFVRAARTCDCYRLFALAGTVPPKPGLVRVEPGSGRAIDLEIWSLPAAAWAEFVAAIPPPLGIGTLFLADGTRVKGFLCESAAVAGAEDISRFGGWRAYREQSGR
jgi:allophanate hydrolase